MRPNVARTATRRSTAGRYRCARMTESAAIEAADAPHVRPAVGTADARCLRAAGHRAPTWPAASGRAWVETNPEGLLLLSSRNRYLALTLAAGVSVPVYVLIGFLRIGAAFLVCHMIGRAYHDDAIGWFRKYLGVRQDAIDSFNRGFSKAEWILIPFFAGSNIVAALSGVHRTPPGEARRAARRSASPGAWP